MKQSFPIRSPRKLIEVALPLDAINVASAKEKSIRHGHPSTLHLWWARRPLAAARAVIFAQLVNDPGYQQGAGFKYGRNKKDAEIERKRLFKLIEDLVLWENTTNEEVLERARAEIRRSWREVCELNKDHPQATELFNPDKHPALHDPFAGGGAIPLEAQRLGLEAYASDINPVAVLINKAMIEIPPKFAGRPPVHAAAAADRDNYARHWKGAQGLAEDVRRYGAWMRDEAERRIGHLYPRVKVTAEMAVTRHDLEGLVGKELTVLAWLWARTVKSPNPAFSHVDVPLVSSFMLSGKDGHQTWIEPVIEERGYRFTVKVGSPINEELVEQGTSAGKWSGFRCLVSDSPISYEYIRAEGTARRMGTRLMAVVAEGPRGRVYLSPSPATEEAALVERPSWQPDLEINYHPRDIKTQIYGLTKYEDLFTARQLAALTTFVDLVSEARERVRLDAVAAGMADDGVGLERDGRGATAYGEAVGVHLGLVASKETVFVNSLSRWRSGEGKTAPAFGRQAIAMVWDFADVNPFAGAGGDFLGIVNGNARAIDALPCNESGTAVQAEAQTQTFSRDRIVSTDPPYYDNIGYADLSDFFYVWLRRALRSVYPLLFASIAVPKAQELVATPYRHGDKETAEAFFLDGMSAAMRGLSREAHPGAPVTIYYAFKQSETTGEAGTVSTGWETFLDAVLRAGFALTGTWPLRTENATRMMSAGKNTLASSIVLVCRKRADTAATVSRREFIRELNAVLPEALDEMTKGSGDARSPVAPVDLSQAIIGPGMAVFSKYAAVLEANGEPMSVRTALLLINRFLAEDDFDRDTQFCLHWFEQNGWGEGSFGDADTLSRAKGTSVEGVKDAGVVKSGGNRVRLLKWSEYPVDWEPQADSRNPVWKIVHHLISGLRRDGEAGAGVMFASLREQGESVRQLAYRLYTLCERQGWSEDARAYNELITSWTGIESAAGAAPTSKQGNLF